MYLLYKYNVKSICQSVCLYWTLFKDSRCWTNEILMLEVAREVTDSKWAADGDHCWGHLVHNTGFWLVIVTLILTIIGWADIFIIIIPLETSPTASWWPHGFIFGASVFVTRWWGRQMVRVRVKFMTTWRIIPLYSPCCAGLTHVCTNNLFNLSWTA